MQSGLDTGDARLGADTGDTGSAANVFLTDDFLSWPEETLCAYQRALAVWLHSECAAYADWDHTFCEDWANAVWAAQRE